VSPREKTRSTWRKATARYQARLRERVRELLGDRCQECDSPEEVELAHVARTRVQGRGRGTYRRLRDVLEHPEAYKLLCRPCHMDFDYGFDPWEKRGPDPAQRELGELEEVSF
jgi:hypothetical protein